MSLETTESTIPAEGLEILDDLIKRYYERLLEDIDENLKPGDLLKMIELRHKLAPSGPEQAKFWAMLSKIRRDSLKNGSPADRPKESKESGK